MLMGFAQGRHLLGLKHELLCPKRRLLHRDRNSAAIQQGSHYRYCQIHITASVHAVGDLHENIVIAMGKSSRSGVDCFDGPKRIALQQDSGVAELRILRDLVRVQFIELGHNRSIVCLKADGEKVCWTKRLVTNRIVETIPAGVEVLRVGGSKIVN